MSFRAALLLFCLALVIGGGELLYQAGTTPEWTDEAKAQAVQSWPLPSTLSGPDYDAYNARWAKAIDALRTNKWPLHDAGAALVAFGLSLAAGLFLLRVRTMADLATLKTPRRRWALYGLGAFAWFGYWASTITALLEGFDRFEFPTWSDTLIIPMVAITGFAVAGWIVLSLAAFAVLRHAALPANLWVWKSDMPIHDWLATGTAALFVLIALELLRETYCYGHWSAVPVMFVWIYCALAFRAAGIARTVT